MKTIVKHLSVLCFLAFTVSACSKDDDPVDNDIFVGDYNGNVSYSKLDDESAAFSNSNGRVTVAKVGGDNYNFIFSDSEIPNLMDITMTKGDNNTLIWENGTAAVIRVTAGDLYILLTRDGETWSADCDR